MSDYNVTTLDEALAELDNLNASKNFTDFDKYRRQLQNASSPDEWNSLLTQWSTNENSDSSPQHSTNDGTPSGTGEGLPSSAPQEEEATFGEYGTDTGTVNEVGADPSSPKKEDWIDKKLKAWKEYAKKEGEPFQQLQDDHAPLSMQVGDTPIKYTDRHNITMGDGEYKKFLEAVKIEKNDGIKKINFGEIKSDEFRAKLAVACLEMGMDMNEGPDRIDLDMECLKNLNLKPEVRKKIEEYNNNKQKDKQRERNQKDRTAENTGTGTPTPPEAENTGTGTPTPPKAENTGTGTPTPPAAGNTRKKGKHKELTQKLKQAEERVGKKVKRKLINLTPKQQQMLEALQNGGR